MSTKISILIVDDDPNLRKTLSGILRARGYAPISVATGKAALDKVEEEIPAVALIDLKLEDISGLELMGEIKECCPGTECILLTGYASQESAIEAVNLGAYSYVQKPYDMEQLLVTVRRAIEKRKAEEALRESEQEKSLILSSVSELVTHQDRELRIIWANRAAAESVGSSPEQLVGRHCYEIWHGHSEPCVGCPVVEAIETGQLQEAEITTPDGRVWFIRGYPVREASGDILGAVEVTLEITARKRAEERVQRLLDQQIAANQLALALGETRDLDEIYHIIHEHVRMLMDAEAFIVSFYDDETQLIRAGYVVSEGTVQDIENFPPIPLEKVGYGTQSQVIRTGEPFYFPDWRRAMERTRTEYTFFEDGAIIEGPPPPEDENISKSALLVPMKIEGETIGVMQAQSYRLDAYSQEDMDLLSALANVAAIAIQNARLYEETRSRAERLAVVNRVARAAGAILHLDDLIETVYQEIISVFQADAFFIALYDEETNELDFRIQVDEGIQEPPARQPLEMGLTSLVVTEKKPLLIRDLGQEQDHLPSPELWGTMKLPASWLGVPMLIGQQLIGVICVQAYRPRAYGEDEELLLSTIAGQVAVAIEQARLYEETRRRALEQETVSRIAYALNTPDVRDAFPVLVEGLQDLTGCDVVNLIAMDEAGEQFITTVLESPFPIPGEGNVTPLSATAAAEDLEANRHHLTADLSTETHFPFEQALHQAGLRSRLTLPLLVGGEVFGALNLGSSSTGLFREEQLPVLQQIADAVALALENSFIFLAEREQRELAEALEEAAAAISSTLEPDQVLDRILEQVERVVAGDAFNIMLIEEGAARVVRSRGYERLGIEERIAHFSTPVVELSSLVQMVQTRKPVVIPDTSTDPDWILLEGWEWVRSYVGALIRVGRVTVGVLNVDGTQPGQFGPTDAHRLAAFADHAAAAIENARLFEQAQQEIAERKRAEEELQQSLEQLRRAFEGTVEVLVSAIEMRDPYTAGHQRRVTQLACAIANEMGLPEEQIQGIRMAGLIHDLGKINIPAEILSKPGTLSDLEYGLIRMHVQAGYDVLKKFDFPWPVAQIVLQHHERTDGSGYPQGLPGEEILLEARILAVSDVVTAMASHRPYRSALGIDKALEEISRNRGVLYDTEMVDICLKLFAEKRFEFE